MAGSRKDRLDCLIEEMLRRGDPTCWVSGVITVRNTGKPLAGVYVHADPSEGGLVASDGRGRYRLPIEIPGVRRMHFAGYGANLNCDIMVARGETLTHDVQFAPVVSDPPYDCIEGEFAGVYERGFEMERFVPHSGHVLDSTRETRAISEAWVKFAPPELRKNFIMGLYHARWYGTIAGPGHFGHMLGSPYLMTVERVVSQARLKKWDELARKYAETHDPKVKGELKLELLSLLRALRKGET